MGVLKRERLQGSAPHIREDFSDFRFRQFVHPIPLWVSWTLMGRKRDLNLGLRGLIGAALAVAMTLYSGPSVSADVLNPELKVVALDSSSSVRDGESCRRRGQVTGTVKRQFICVWAKTVTASGRVISRRLVWELRVSNSSTTTTTNSASTTTTLPRLTCATGGECRVGDIGAGGGVVFYVASTPQWWGRYMEAAPNRWNGQWGDVRHVAGCNGLSIPGASAVGMGSGMRNTEAIVAACPESSIAARVANDLVLNGKSDWFLPSRDELNAMYPHRAGIGMRLTEDNQVYSSSTFSSALTFWGQLFTDDAATGNKSGQQFGRVPRTYSYFVRPIRYGS